MKNYFIFGLVVLVGFGFVSVSFGSSIVEQVADFSVRPDDNMFSLGQKLGTGLTGTVYSLNAYLYVSTTTDNFQASLREGESWDTTQSSIVASSSFYNFSVGTSSREFVLQDPYVLDPDKYYWIHFSYGGDPNVIYGSVSDVYLPGTQATCRVVPGAGQCTPVQDLYFSVNSVTSTDPVPHVDIVYPNSSTTSLFSQFQVDAYFEPDFSISLWDRIRVVVAYGESSSSVSAISTSTHVLGCNVEGTSPCGMDINEVYPDVLIGSYYAPRGVLDNSDVRVPRSVPLDRDTQYYARAYLFTCDATVCFYPWDYDVLNLTSDLIDFRIGTSSLYRFTDVAELDYLAGSGEGSIGYGTGTSSVQFCDTVASSTYSSWTMNGIVCAMERMSQRSYQWTTEVIFSIVGRAFGEGYDLLSRVFPFSLYVSINEAFADASVLNTSSDDSVSLTLGGDFPGTISLLSSSSFMVYDRDSSSTVVYFGSSMKDFFDTLMIYGIWFGFIAMVVGTILVII